MSILWNCFKNKRCRLAVLVLLLVSFIIWQHEFIRTTELPKVRNHTMVYIKRWDSVPSTGIYNSERSIPTPTNRIIGDSTDTKHYMICWYNPIGFLRKRPKAMKLSFEKCEYSNCQMTFNRKDASKSDAVLFDGYKMEQNIQFKKPMGQIWVFVAHETPTLFADPKGKWKGYSFNWTMTYDKNSSDIHLPYGEFRKHNEPVKHNFRQIAKRKQKDALMIASHCPTDSKREDFVKILKKYIDVEILGKCGTPWNCSKSTTRDDCFQILNKQYRYYLAFENALCSEYFTEKLHENYNYDILLIVRGGSKGQASSIHPKGTIIATDDFSSIKKLGEYLQQLSSSKADYAAMLEKKSQYYTTGYTEGVYQRVLCDLCERMNNQEKYYKVIPDISQWKIDGKASCRLPTDIERQVKYKSVNGMP